MSELPTIAGNRHVAGRGLIIVVAGLAALLALWFASPWLAGLAQIATALIVLAICVQAVVDRGRSQAFAIGFAICALAFWLVRWSQIPFFISGFGTESLNNSVHKQIARTIWVDTTTGQEFDYDPAIGPSAEQTRNAVPADVDLDGFPDLVGAMAPPIRYSRRRQPDADVFRVVARCWWTILLGVAGGRFAQYWYLRNAQGEPG